MDARPDTNRTADTASANPVPADTEPLTDEQVGAVVRDLAASWAMPPRSLHEVTWHERVGPRGRGGGAAGSGRGWARGFGARMAAAMSLAITGVVILAIAAVWLRSPASPGLVGGSDAPTASNGAVSATPTAPAAAVASPSATAGSTAAAPSFPAAALVGQPLPGRYVPIVNSDGYIPLDLGNGSLAQPVAGGVGSGQNVVIRADGTLLCVCEQPDASGQPRNVDRRVIVLREFRPDGTLIGETELKTLEVDRGPNDPLADPITPVTNVSATLSGDGAVLFVGWSLRQGDTWRSGVLVVDVERAVEMQTVDLPDVAVAPHEQRFNEAPQVALSPNGSAVVIRFRTVTEAAPPPYQRWSAPFAGGRIGALTQMAAGGGTLFDLSCSVPLDEGFATDERYYALCLGDDFALDRLAFRLVGLDGNRIRDTPLGELAPDVAGVGFAIDRRTGSWYAWSPFGQRLARIDLATGALAALTTIERPTSSAGGDWLAGLGRTIGRWVAPSAAAKVLIEPSLALAPDGSRLYALAVASDDPTKHETIAPGGILVIDTTSLTLLDHWPPTADYDSIAISGDGAWIYALGMPGVDAQGKESGTTQASLTVHRATDGEVRLRAARFSSFWYEFPAATLP